MTLGGGTWTTQNKKLPGTYINFISVVRAMASMADRGYGTMALELDWGPEDIVFKVTNEEFQKASMKYFGYDYSADQMKGLRDLFKNLQTGYFYRLSNGAKKAANDLATAKYSGIRGNAFSVAVQVNVDNEALYDVITYINQTSDVVGEAKIGIATTATVATMTVVDKQTVASWGELSDNDYVVFKRSGEISDAVAAATPLTGGDNGNAVTVLEYQKYLDAIEPYYFNTMGCISTEKSIQDLFIQFTKRLRDEVGSKFQCIVYAYDNADYEGIISVANRVIDEGENQASLVYWLTGAEASCAVNASCTNKTYDGDFTVDTNYKQSELEKAITDGKLIFHRVTDAVDGDIVGGINILRDINTFTSFTKQKNEDFSNNQVIRVLDQHAIDIARLFNKTYLGKEQNDDIGRTALWGDIVAYEKEMQRLRAIQNFNADDVPIPQQGNAKEVVFAQYAVQPTVAMEKLYMDIYIK